MALPEEIGNPHWPPFGREPGPEHAWLRFQTLNVGDRRAVVAAHVQVPYVVDVGGPVSSLDQIAPFVAYNYLTTLNTYLKCKNGIGLGVPPWTRARLHTSAPSGGYLFGQVRVEATLGRSRGLHRGICHARTITNCLPRS